MLLSQETDEAIENTVKYMKGNKNGSYSKF